MKALVLLSTVSVLLLFTLSGAVAGVAFAASTASMSAGTTHTSVYSLPNVSVLSKVSPAITMEDSDNWAGYGANPGTPVTKTVGSWIQPTVKCNPNVGNQGVVFWVGIDGLTSDTVEQTGTFAECTVGKSTPTYVAWTEFYPAQPIEVIGGFAVHPGDVFVATISAPSDSSFKVTIKDMTTGKSYSANQPQGFTATRADGECITETPYDGSFLSIPNFKTVSWGHDFTKVSGTCTVTTNGKTSPIGSFGSNTYELTIVNENNNSIVCVATSALQSDNESFKNIWKSAGP